MVLKSENDKQIVYKIDGDFNGDIKGKNITIILMGNGNINGDISVKDGEVVLISGDINGDVKANKVITPQNQSAHKASCESCKSASSHFGNNTCYCNRLMKYVSIDNTCSAYLNKKDNKAEINEEETSITNYMAVHPIHLTCPKCHGYYNKNLRIDMSVANNKILHTMVTPL